MQMQLQGKDAQADGDIFLSSSGCSHSVFLEDMGEFRDEDAFRDESHREHFRIESSLSQYRSNPRSAFCLSTGVVVTTLLVLAYWRGGDREDGTVDFLSTPPASAGLTLAPTALPQNLNGCFFQDRFDNEHNFQNNMLFPGQFICSTNHTDNDKEHHRYQFGVSPEGNLVLRDTMIPTSETYHYDRVLYRNPKTSVLRENHYFSLQINGTFRLHGTESEPWHAVPKQQMHLTKQCLEDHDCPYLHLHADGVLVINYIDDANEWQSKNSLRVYNF